MIHPAQVKTGDLVKHYSIGNVKIINVDGSTAMIRLADGSWRQCPLADLEPVDITAGTSVRTGPISEKITGEEFAKRVLLQSWRESHPGVAGMADNYGVLHLPDPLRPGTVLLEKSTGKPLTLISSSEARDLYVCKNAIGELSVMRSSELLMGDRTPLTKVAESGSLQKRASGFVKGERVKTKDGKYGTIVTSLPHTSVVQIDGLAWEDGLKNFSNEDLQAI